MEDFVGRKSLIPRERLKALMEKSDRAGALQTLSHFGAIALTGWGLWVLWGSWWMVPVFILHGALLNFLFAAQHEFNHYTAFRTRWINDVMNRITGFIVLYPRTYERLFHFEHHRHTQDWDRDPELLIRAPYTLSSYLWYLSGITYWYGVTRRLILNARGRTAAWLTPADRLAVIQEARWTLVAYGVVAALSVAAGSWIAVQLWLLPMLATKAIHQLQNLTEHTGLTHEADTVHNTRTILAPWPLRWMAWNMQYHTAHHTFPGVPFHRQPALHRELVARAGYQPPTIGYLEFQWKFLKALLKGPEPTAGWDEVTPGLANRARSAATATAAAPALAAR